MKLSIIIPVFNEEKTISKIIKKVRELNIDNFEIEIIVIDDGSTDATASEIKNLKLKIKNFKVFTHTKNFGKGAALRSGIKNSNGDYIVVQDADLEYNPKYIAKMVTKIQKGNEVVYGTRLKRWPNLSRDEKTLRFLIHYLGNRFLSLMVSILYWQWLTDIETCYKLIPRSAIKSITLSSMKFDIEAEITSKLLKNGWKIIEIPISTTPRGYHEGKKLNTIKDGMQAIIAIMKFRFVD